MVNNSTNVNKTNNYQEPRIIEHNIDHGIWNLNSRSWFGTGTHIWWCSGADPGFQVRGGALKKVAPSRGRREHCWGISCEKSRFYAKKSYFFQWIRPCISRDKSYNYRYPSFRTYVHVHKYSFS